MSQALTAYKKPLSILLASASLLSLCGVLAWQSLLLVCTLCLALVFYRKALVQKSALQSSALWLTVFIVGLTIGLYRPEGFNYPLVFNVDALHTEGQAFALYLNTAKVLAGIAVLVFLLPISIKKPSLKTAPWQIILTMLVCALMINTLAWHLLDLQVHTKTLFVILSFLAVNLSVTCLAEEAFMRLLLQGECLRAVSKFTENKLIREGLPLALCTLIFILTHFPSSLNMLIVFGLAGFAYGLIYALTKNITYAIGLHFSVNALHFLFLTYPL
ncbi:lysostaphin resistance A-like protein [Agaribacterium sp. ZY112]|uniref:CPBP family intramembrane glutamic endopeptidase n=1 Tax=Agaribacterium sp. ZY112 TaxID=3233574 RepID=UPI003525C06A